MDGSRIALRLLGPPEVWAADGTPLDMPVGKPLALLVYLHLHGAPASREALGHLLWPDVSRDRARGSLRQALWAIRRALGEDLFLGDDPLQLAPGRVNSDLQDLRLRLLEGDVEGAKALWRGLPFQDFRILDASPWTRWSEELGQELEDRFVLALTGRGRRLWDQGQAAEAIPWFEEALSVQPNALRHSINLTETYLDLRRFDAATEILKKARRIAETPDEERTIEELERRLQTLQKGQPGGSRSGDPPHLPFVGRSQEFASLLQGWRQAQAGRSRLALITGEPGIGKTRVSQELGLVVSAEGGRVVSLKGEDSERPIEWGLLTELVKRLLKLSGAAGISPDSDAILSSLVPSPVATGESESGPWSGLRAWIRPSTALSDAIGDLLQSVTEDGPLLVIVDDLQWADPESRAVLTRVAVHLKTLPIFLLFTCRSDLPDPGVRKTLTLLTEARALRIEMAAWSLKELTELLGPVISFSSPTQGIQVIGRIHQASRGNPLFVLELLKVLQEEGFLELGTEGRWSLRSGSLPEDFPLPGTVRALVDRQLAQLSDEGTMVAAHLARMGHSTSARTLALRAGMNSAAVTQGMTELLQRRLVRWEEGDNLGFIHDEIRAAVSRRFQLRADPLERPKPLWPPSPALLTGLTTLALFAGIAQWVDPPSKTVPPPFGSGRILLQTGDTVLSFELRTPSSDGLVPVPEFDLPIPDPDRLDDVEASFGRWELRRARDSREPTLTHLIVSLREEDETPEGVEPRILLSTRGELRFGAFSPSLRWIAAGVGGAADSLFLFDLSGEPMATLEVPPLLGASWCGEEALSLLVRNGGTPELVFWSPSTGSWTPTPIREVLPGGELACSPSGSTLLLQGVRSGDLGLFLHLSGGQILPLTLPPGVQPHRIRWIPSPPDGGRDRLSIEGDRSRVLAWGETLHLEAHLPGVSKEALADDLRWTTSNPARSLVSPSGKVLGRGEGPAWIRAEWRGWLRDSIQVEVIGSTHQNVALHEGDPVFRADSLRRNVRGFTGGGTGPLPDGGLVEVELRARRPLEPGDQGQICLISDSSPDTSPPPAYLCLALPGETGARWDPLEALFRTHHPFPPQRHLLPRWPNEGTLRLALRVGADGMVEVFLDGEKATAPWPIRLGAEGEGGWRVQLRETSVREGDFSLEWLGLTLWTGDGPYR